MTLQCLLRLSGLALVTILPVTAAAQGDARKNSLSVTVSTGVLLSPSYLGDDDTQFSLVPNLRLEYGDRFSAGLEGLQYSAIKTDNFSLGPILRYNFGRDEEGSNPFAISGNDTTDLIGLGDIDGTPEIGAFAKYSIEDFTIELEVRHGIDGHEGLVGAASLKYNTGFAIGGRAAFLSFGPTLSYGDDNFNSTFFDVDADQSSLSGLSQYDAGGGLNSLGVEGLIFYPLTERVSLSAFAEYENLQGDIADSSLVIERGSEDQFTAGLFLNYHF